MKSVYFTFDYELFFGSSTGDVMSCLIDPTEELIRIGDETNSAFTFFVDAGYIWKLKKECENHSCLKKDFLIVSEQLRRLRIKGHSIQLHIHPHWEDSVYDGSKWIIDAKRYRLHSFSESEIDEIVGRYKKILVEISGEDVMAFRAGGWCLQPFDKIGPALAHHNITLDSTVYRNGRIETPTHYFDFRGAPKKDEWRFSSDPLIEDKLGSWTELPISSQWVSPLFYWRFAFTKIIKNQEHRIYGNGAPIGNSFIEKIKMLFLGGIAPASVDGYRSIQLQGLVSRQKSCDQHLVVIGHPKALSKFSIKKMRESIDLAKEKGMRIVAIKR